MENVYQNPVVFKIHNGTERSTINLCGSCCHAHRTVAAQTGEERVRCMVAYNAVVQIRGPIAKCNTYSDKNLPTLSDMNEIAWSLMTDKGGRKIGFQSPEQRRDRDGSNSPMGF